MIFCMTLVYADDISHDYEIGQRFQSHHMKWNEVIWDDLWWWCWYHVWSHIWYHVDVIWHVYNLNDWNYYIEFRYSYGIMFQQYHYFVFYFLICVWHGNMALDFWPLKNDVSHDIIWNLIWYCRRPEMSWQHHHDTTFGLASICTYIRNEDSYAVYQLCLERTEDGGQSPTRNLRNIACLIVFETCLTICKQIPRPTIGKPQLGIEERWTTHTHTRLHTLSMS